MRNWIILGIVLAIAASIIVFLAGPIQRVFFLPRTPKDARSSYKTTEKDDEAQSVPEVVATDLHIPWEIEFLPGGDLLVTERPGDLVRIDKDSKKRIEISGVEHIGEGGLLGLALHPEYERNGYIYLYLTTSTEEGLTNRIERHRLDKNTLSNRKIVFDGIPGARFHDGGKIEFGPDGYLYVTTGDAGNENAAQDISSLSGKMLRIHDDGSIPENNPFNNAVWSYGHRNPQGLVWDSNDQLWSAEHGPSGLETGNDEVNLIKRGGNYGWPVIRGRELADGMESPVIESGKDETWAPAAIAVVQDRVFFTGLRGEALYSAEIEGERLVNLKRNFFGQFGRLRALKLGPDGYLYMSTSNTDGRGESREGDDKIIRVDPKKL
ncbi:PQQ-dependent sugar dehydrogenase [Patescibacteria group bacterium]